MSDAQSVPPRWWVASVIAWREVKSAVWGAGGYFALTLAALAAAWMLMIDVQALKRGGLLIEAEPFRSPVAAAMLVLALFLAVSAAVSAARDRESGALEVLFYGPVDEVSYVSGKVGGWLAAYVAALPVLLLSLMLLALMTGFRVSPIILASLALSVVPAAEIVGFGVLLSIGTNRVRSALLLLIGVAALLLGVTIAYRMVLLVPIDNPASAVLPLRDALAAIDAVARWISPFAYLERVVDGIATGAWRTALVSFAAAAGYAAAMIMVAAYWLRRRGVHRRGE